MFCSHALSITTNIGIEINDKRLKSAIQWLCVSARNVYIDMDIQADYNLFYISSWNLQCHISRTCHKGDESNLINIAEDER